MEIQYLQEAAVYESCIKRLDQLQPESPPHWGKMNPAQMFAHCAEVQEVLNGSRLLEKTPFLLKLLGPLIKRAVLNTKPFPKSSQTHPQYIVRSDKDFQMEKARLVASLNAFRQMEDQELLAAKHPIFGKMDANEKG
ncbi:MAG: DUF1569 domain-containing protein, partial [Bacteroidota bacterium]